MVGTNVRRLRLARDLSQEVLAERTGKTQQYISGLESGRRNPTIITVFEFAQVLGVSPADLLTP